MKLLQNVLYFQGWEFAQKNERFAHLLIFGERPERIAHSRSIDLSEMSEWANERMSEFPALCNCTVYVVESWLDQLHVEDVSVVDGRPVIGTTIMTLYTLQDKYETIYSKVGTDGPLIFLFKNNQ